MASINKNLRAVAGIVAHQFRDIYLLKQALSHRSISYGKNHGYERLEFLGDRVLGLCIADLLMTSFPDEPEGALSRRFNALVCQETLAEISTDLGLGDYILFGSAERESGAAENPAILSDICEALIAALYLDGGMDAARRFIHHHWKARLEKMVEPPKDSKSALQEWAMARKLPIPSYRQIGREGPDHAPVFTIQVALEGQEPEQDRGVSKRLAEQKAAALMLEKVKKHD